MLSSRRTQLFLCLLCVYVIAGLMQSQPILSGDVSWLILTTKKLLAGGDYINDFFETNPPLILYLYTPPVVFAKIFSLNDFLAMYGYLFLLATLSLYLCSKWCSNVFLVMLAIVFLIVPIDQFGQREHLIVLLTMPYFLAVAYQLQGNRMNRHEAVIVGLMAGLGFAIKPYFAAAFILVEFYYLISKRNLFSWLRTETIIIATLALFYISIIFIFYKNFTTIMMPYFMRLYYQGMGDPWHLVFKNTLAIFCCLPFVLFLIQYKKNQEKALQAVLSMALIGFLLGYFMQRTAWYYHLLPAYSIALLSFFLLFHTIVSEAKVRKLHPTTWLLSSIIMAIFLVGFYPTIWTVLVFYPMAFYGFFSLLFVGLLFLSQTNKNLGKVIASVAMIISIAYLFSHLYQAGVLPWMNRFSMTILVLALLFYLFLPGDSQNKYHYMAVAWVGGLMFIYPFFLMNGLYQMALANSKHTNELIKFIKSHAPHQSIYVLSTTPVYAFPAVDYAGVSFASSVHFCWMLPGLVKQEATPMDSKTAYQYLKDKNFFIDKIADDLKKNKPALIFVDVNEAKHHLKNIKFDYLNYFSQNKKFQSVWQSYQYLTTLREPGVLGYDYYKFQVYRYVGTQP